MMLAVLVTRLFVRQETQSGLSIGTDNTLSLWRLVKLGAHARFIFYLNFFLFVKLCLVCKQFVRFENFIAVKIVWLRNKLKIDPKIFQN